MTAALSDEQGRAVTALADVAWAYGEAMARGDTARASQLLALFQSLYSGYRSAVLAAYPEAQRAAVDPVLPRALMPDAIYGPQTRLALTAVLGVAFGSAAHAALGSMPTTASQFGTWFTSTLRPIAPSFGDVWARAQELAPMDLAATLGGELEGYILGLEEPPPPETARLRFDPRIFSPMVAMRNHAATVSQPAAAPGGDQLISKAPQLPVAKQRFSIPTWAWVALGLSGAAAVGFVAWRASR